jgi:hypothetical protein
MTYQRLPYEDAAPTTEMVSDCAAVGRALHLRAGRVDPDKPPYERQGPDQVVVPERLAERAREMQVHFG